MPFSHHSHSGQFCYHAQGTLEEMVQGAISKNMRVFALTEHMPRDDEDLYPEETQAHVTSQGLKQLFAAFHKEALQLREKYKDHITLLVGLETEWIRPSSQRIIDSILSQYELDFFVGSVHHVHTLPIDFNKDLYLEALHHSLKNSGGTDPDQESNLFGDYFDAQYEMLKALQPPVVAHFDLIRLYSSAPDKTLRSPQDIWIKINRNLDFIKNYGGFLEVNTSALRKGLAEPYPNSEICKTFVEIGGGFVLSDDSHRIDQIGYAYTEVLRYAEKCGIRDFNVLGRKGTAPQKVLVESLRNSGFFSAEG